MKYIGVLRKIDKLGRLVLVKEFRDYLNIDSNEVVYIYLDKNHLLISNKILEDKKLLSLRKIDKLGRLCLPKKYIPQDFFSDEYAQKLTENWIELESI